ncbi:MAG: hypothetical protein KatS3mg131_2344 [Candidatus Tectimicrobiota bacterium]|nr:MAG: hypothetical protein KatS3mg131_2344 [Candidatus Tectomicrobia bacterium]
MNCLVPGFFITLPPDTPEGQQRRREQGRFLAIGRTGEPEEIGPLTVFLASAASDHMTGQAVVTDGGGLAAGPGTAVAGATGAFALTWEERMEGYTLVGKTALVTGVEHPAARAAAAALAEAGADVAVLAGRADAQAQAEAAAAAVAQHQRLSRAYAVEVASLSAVQTVVQELIAAWGHLDILVNGLDLPFARPFLETTDSDWERVMSHVLYGTLHCIRAVAPHMLARRHGRIITYLSVLAERGMAHCAAYSAVQAALLQLTRTLAVEWGRHGITVNALGYGWCEGSPFLPAEPAERDRLLRYIPDHRLGQPDDLAALTVYLASDLGGNLTGQVTYVEGGLLSHP